MKRDLTAVITVMLIALGVTLYLLEQQRVRFPLLEPGPFVVQAEFSTAQAVTPGQGQTVRVSGVRVGDVAGVDLEGGRAVVTLHLDPEYEGLVRTDASALLRPKTGLKDMVVELYPGSKRAPAAREGFRLPVLNTQPDVNLDEILSALDADTRDYLKLLVHGVGEGVRGRGDELAEVFARFEPTHRDLARVTGAVARRKDKLRQLVRSMRLLSEELAGKDTELSELVGTSARTFSAFAAEQTAVSDSIGRLPQALRDTRLALGQVGELAQELRPAADALRPALRELERASESVLPLAREATPVLREQIRPFVREARPLVRDLEAPGADVARAAPDAVTTLSRLNRLANMLAYNDKGRQGPDVAGRDEGYLFWLGWLDHIAAAVHATGDAHGPFRPLVQQGNCTTLNGFVDTIGNGDPLVNTVLLGLQGVFTDERICGESVSGGTTPVAKALRREARRQQREESR